MVGVVCIGISLQALLSERRYWDLEPALAWETGGKQLSPRTCVSGTGWASCVLAFYSSCVRCDDLHCTGEDESEMSPSPWVSL